SFCWIYENNVAKRIEVQTGVTDGEWIEVTNRRLASSQPSQSTDSPWTPIDGTEQVIIGNLSTLAEGGSVNVAPQRVAGGVPLPKRGNEAVRAESTSKMSPGGRR